MVGIDALPQKLFFAKTFEDIILFAYLCIMNQQDNHILLLREAMEKKAGRHMHTPKDFDFLSESIFESLHQKVSATTLKRLWGYAGQDTKPRMFTLDLLARFAGYRDYGAFEKSIGNEGEQQSQLFLSDTITADMLAVGDRLLLTWHPDRRCVC